MYALVPAIENPAAFVPGLAAHAEEFRRMEGLDVKATLDGILVFVAQNYLLLVWVLGAYFLGRWRGRSL
jgi:hypothetical protein